MSSNYKKLGNYIQPVNRRNTDLKVKTLLGVSVQKIFIPSIANTVGTNFKNYKIVRKNQFVYIADTSRRGDKIGLAMLEEYDEALVSQAYTVFEIIDKKELDPEYLMMWFRRPEFDRYARYKSHGSVREIFDWEEMCEVALPIPSIEKQREIVNEYNTVTNRIKLNEQLNQKLEETAQALYKHWFVDFEFPNEEGKPYKSSGGEMVYNEELDKEIPVGWEVTDVENTVDIIRGASPRPINEYMSSHGMPWVKISDATACINKFLFETKEYIIDDGVSKSRLVKPETLILSNSASPGLPRIMKIEACVHDGWLIFNNYKNVTREYIVEFLLANKQDILSNSNGSVFKNLKTEILKNYRIIVPSTPVINSYTSMQQKIDLKQEAISTEINKLSQLKDLLLSKMTKVEVEKEML